MRRICEWCWKSHRPLTFAAVDISREYIAPSDIQDAYYTGCSVDKPWDEKNPQDDPVSAVDGEGPEDEDG